MNSTERTQLIEAIAHTGENYNLRSHIAPARAGRLFTEYLDKYIASSIVRAEAVDDVLSDMRYAIKQIEQALAATEEQLRLRREAANK